MNWKEIKEKYPKSSNLLSKWNTNMKNWSNISSIMPPRDLYDFFDEQGIIIGIPVDYTYLGEKYVYMFEIIHPENTRCHEGEWYDTREEAEESAWMKAFEILEEQLNKKT